MGVDEGLQTVAQPLEADLLVAAPADQLLDAAVGEVHGGSASLGKDVVGGVADAQLAPRVVEYLEHPDGVVERDGRALGQPLAQAAGYRRLRQWLTRLYRTEFDGFIAANFDSPLSLLTPQLAQLTAIGGFRKWDRMVRRYITDPRLQRIFTFQSLYAGVAPRDALAVYAVIAYMDTISGVVFPRGGVRALPDALAAAASDAGVRFCYGATVTALERTGGRVSAVVTEGSGRIACDAVVLTTELPQTYALLGRTPRRPGRLRSSARVARSVTERRG